MDIPIKLPDWFYELFHKTAIQYHLNYDLAQHHLNVSKKIYFEFRDDLNNGIYNKEEYLLQSIENHFIGQSYINDEDETSKLHNGNQFLFLGDFYHKLYDQIVIEISKSEKLPEFEFKTEAQKIIWLKELGVLEMILNRCEREGNYNWTKAANLIHTFTNINVDTIRQCLTAIYQPNKTNAKNNPYNNSENLNFVSDLKTKFKLD